MPSSLLDWFSLFCTYGALCGITSCAFLSLGFLWLKRKVLKRTSHGNRKQRVIVIVFGDVARSPRMMNWANSFASYGIPVTMIGYIQTKLPKEVRNVFETPSASRPLPAGLSILSSQAITAVPLRQFAIHGKLLGLFNCPYYLYILLRVIYDFSYLAYALFYVFITSEQQISWTVLQNPPSVPQIAILNVFTAMANWVYGPNNEDSKNQRNVNLQSVVAPHSAYKTDRPGKISELILDFHNFGYTILGVKLGSEKRLIVRVLKFFEVFLTTRCMDRGFCVSEKMKNVLLDEWFGRRNIRLEVLYDLPKERQLELSSGKLKEKKILSIPATKAAGNGDGDITKMEANQEFWQEIFKSYLEESPAARARNNDPVSHLHYSLNNKYLAGVRIWLEEEMQGKGNVIKIVSSSSWTPDEDFTWFFSSLLELHKRLTMSSASDDEHGSGVENAGGVENGGGLEGKITGGRLPRVVIFLTGKGDLRDKFMEMYESELEEHIHDTIRVCFLWLKHEEYPRLLKACDWGMCMHQSSSGLDLPMKVVDMFAAQLPVIARDYFALDELVHRGRNGFVFSTKRELLDLLEQCCRVDGVGSPNPEGFRGSSKTTDYHSMKKYIEEGFRKKDGNTWEQAFSRIVWTIFSGERVQ